MYIKSLSLFLKLARASFLKTQSKGQAASVERAAACEGGLESCNCLSGHGGERLGPTASAFGEQDLDAPLTGEEAVQACGAPGPDGHWASCHFRLPSSLGWKRKGRRSGQPGACPESALTRTVDPSSSVSGLRWIPPPSHFAPGLH